MKNQQLYDMAKSLLGQNLCGDQHELGCALTVNAIFKKAFGEEIGGGASTADMYKAIIDDNTRFQRVNIPITGSIIISPTGMGNGKIPGHVGIVANYGILSNDSSTGLLAEEFTLKSWYNYYQEYGGIKTYYFNIL